jgi:hypothetical protein
MIGCALRIEAHPSSNEVKPDTALDGMTVNKRLVESQIEFSQGIGSPNDLWPVLA